MPFPAKEALTWKEPTVVGEEPVATNVPLAYVTAGKRPPAPVPLKAIVMPPSPTPEELISLPVTERLFPQKGELIGFITIESAGAVPFSARGGELVV